MVTRFVTQRATSLAHRAEHIQPARRRFNSSVYSLSQRQMCMNAVYGRCRSLKGIGGRNGSKAVKRPFYYRQVYRPSVEQWGRNVRRPCRGTRVNRPTSPYTKDSFSLGACYAPSSSSSSRAALHNVQVRCTVMTGRNQVPRIRANVSACTTLQ